MFQNKKSWRKVLLPICFVAILIFGMGGWKFQSVNSYKEEQEKVQQDSDSTKVESETGEKGGQEGQESRDTSTSQPAGNTKLANGGKLVTPTVPQDADGTGNTGEPGESKPGNDGGDEAGTVPDTSGNGSGKEGQNGKAANTSGGKKGSSGGTKGTATQAPSGGKPGKESVTVDSSNPDSSGKTETAYNPQRTPSPAKEPKEGMVTGTVTIDCTSILGNMDALDGNLHGFVPSSGYIVKGQSFQLKEGANAFMALQTVCRELDIQLDTSFTPIYNSYYIKGIGYLYEKSAGRKSGWLYSVNGEIPKVSASAYTLKEGDQITFMYTCNGGNDVK